ncbi:MAG: tripartite tricarboxylate transporter permease [Oscillospiraceae bacterium]
MNILYVALGVFAGIYVGAIPGLSVTMATSILIAMTFSWDTNAALALMIGVYVGGVYGGSRSAIMLNIPGAPAAVATTFDGYPLAKKGEAGKAIAVSTLTSVVGGFVGLLALWLAAPLVSRFALSFSPRDYFLLTTMGLLLVGSMGVSSVPKGLFAAAAGLMLGVVGMDPISGLGRLTFGSVELRGGLNYIAIMIGLFGIGEALYQIRYRKKPVVRQKVDSIRPPKKKLLKLLPLSLRSGLIGTAVGALPGAGGEIAALLAYDAAKRTVKNPETPFGEGAYEGVVAPESANNAAIGGALIPMLTLGIPGDSVTAILIGALAIHGIRVGPMVMASNPGLFTTIVVMLLLANIFLLIFGMMGIKVFAKLTEMPRGILIPLIIVISVIGSFSVNNMTTDILWTLAFGVIGYFMKCNGFPVAPMVLGLILGPIIEVNFRRGVISAGGPLQMLGEMFTHPLSLILLAVMVLMIVTQIIGKKKKTAKK